MAYADQPMSGNRVIAIIIVALIHIALGYALVTGLAYEATTKLIERVTTIDVDEPPPPEPEDEPPPPEPQPDTAAPPPPVAPPPPMNIATRPPDIRTQVTIPPPAPPVVRLPPPAPPAPPAPVAAPPPPPPPAPSQARGPSRRNQNSWVGRIQGDYPTRAVRQGESGTVQMRITVGPDGRVQACSVTGSSGSSALDEAGCRGMQRYARYDPALNAAGEPISSTMNEAIRYDLPE